jgi:GTP1/Obg family GTP-binding protein
LQWAHWKTDSGVIETWVNPHFQIIKDSAKDEYEVYWNVIHKVVQSCPSMEEAQAFCQRLRDVLDGRDVVKEIVDALDAKATRMISDANMLRWEKGKKEAAGIREAVELVAEGWLGNGVTEEPGQESRRRGTEEA